QPVTGRRPPRRGTAPPRGEWGGEHCTSIEGDRLCLWSVVRTERTELAVHRASLRGANRAVPQVSFDSVALKPKNRRWRALTHAMLMSLPAAHRNAVVRWNRPDNGHPNAVGN